MPNRTQGTPSNHQADSSDRSLKLIEFILSTEGREQTSIEDSACCDDETLCAYIDGTLPKTERTEVEAHLARCARCLNELVSLYEMVKSVESAHPQPVPDRIWRIADVSPPEKKSWWQRLLDDLIPNTAGRIAAYGTCLLVIIGTLFFLMNRGRVDVPGQVKEALVATARLPKSPELFEDPLSLDWLPPDRVITKGESVTSAAIHYFRLGVYSAMMTRWAPDNQASEIRDYYRLSLERLEQQLEILQLPKTFIEEISQLRRSHQNSLDRARRFNADLAKYLHEKRPDFDEDFWFAEWAFAVRLYAKHARDLQGTFPNQLRKLLDPKLISRFRQLVQRTEWAMKGRILQALDQLEALPLETKHFAPIEWMVQRIVVLYLLENWNASSMLVNLEPPEPPFRAETWVNKKTDPTYQIGEEIRFFFRAESDCYITLLYVDANGEMTLLFPNRFQPDNRVRANQTDTAIPAESPQLKVQEPAGTEWVKVIATPEPLSFQAEAQRYFEENRGDFFDALEPEQMTAELLNANNWATDVLIITIRP